MSNSTIRVLLIEDNPADMLLLRTALEADRTNRFMLTGSQSLSQGLSLLGSERFDIVLLDLGLTDSDGLATYEQVHQQDSHLPIVVLTDHADGRDAIQAVNAGAQDYLVKCPVGWEMAARTILHAIESHKLEKSLLESEMRFSTAFHASPAAQVISRLEDGLILDANEAYCLMLEYKRDELVGHTSVELGIWVKPEDRHSMMEELIREGRIRNLEIEVRTHHGKIITLLMSFELIELNGEKCIIATGLDITERMQAEASHRKGEEEYRFLFDNNPHPMWVYDQKTLAFLAVNDAAVEKYGYTREEFLQMTLADIRPAEDVPRLMQFLAQGRPVLRSSGEWRHLLKDGTIIDVEIKSHALRMGNHDSALVVVQDITERKRAETQLAEALRYTEQVLSSSPVGILTYKFTGECLSANAFAAKLVGTTTDKLESQNFRELASWKISGLYALAEQAITSGKPVTSDIHLVSTFDKESWFNAQFVTFRSAGEDLLLLLINDITERKLAEEALQESEQRFRRLFTTSPDAILLIDPYDPDVSWPIVDCNEAACRMNGYTREELIGQSIDILNTSAGTAKERTTYMEQLRREEVVLTEVFHRHRDGHLFPVEVSTSVINFEGRELVMGIDRDITERKRGEEALQQSERKFRTLFEIAPVGISVIDREHNIIDANYALQRITGLTRQELLDGAHLKRTYLRPDGSIMPLDELAGARAIRERMPIFDIETGNITEDRGVIWTHVSAAPLQTSNSNVVVITQDITERAQAIREIQQRTEDLLLIKILNDAANHEKDIEGIVNIFTYETRKVFNCQAVAIYLLSPDGKYLEMQSNTIPRNLTDKIEKLIGRPIPKVRIPLREGSFLKQILLNERGTILNDPKVIRKWIEEFSETTFLPPAIRPAIRKIVPQIHKILNTGSAISIPLIASGRAIGIMDMSSTGQFTEEDLQRIQTISSQVTAVLMRKQAEQQVQLQLRRLSALSEIDRVITSTLDMRLSIEVLLSEVLSQLGVDAATVLLLNESNLMLEYYAGKGFRSLAIRQFRIRLGDGLAGHAGLERKLLHVSNLAEAGSQFIRAGLFKEEGFVEYFGVPLVAKGMLKGVLEIFHRTPLYPDIEWTNYLKTLGGQAAIAIDNAQLFEGMQKSNLEIVAAYDATIAGWSHAMDLRDKETEGHTLRVTELTLKLAEKMGIGQQEQVHIRRGALLHDIGKLGVPDPILLKPGKLTEEEWAIMRQHPTYAFEMLSAIHYLRPALDIPYCHHENWDGTGYPRGLQGELIPLAARIFAVVDVWDALTSDRPYRKAWTKEETLEYIQEQSGKRFDPTVVNVFLKMLASDKTTV